MRRPVAIPMAFVVAIATCGCAPPRSTRPASAAARAAPTPWSYSGVDGPDHWGELARDFVTCGSGTHQSPIDLPRKAESDPSRLLILPRDPLVLVRVKNTGHALQFDVAPGSWVTFGGVAFPVQQFHFHVPAEHTVAGRRFDAELHLVHKTPDGRLLVIAVLFERGPDNPTLTTLLADLPVRAGEERPALGVKFDVGALLPQSLRFFQYEGSLTAPPCTEPVSWLVFDPSTANPPSVSEVELQALRAGLGPTLSRPIQATGSRTVRSLGR